MNELTCNGRFPGNASTDDNGANSARNPGAFTWNTRSARDKSRNRCSPRSTNSTPSAKTSRARSAVACEHTI